MLAEIKPEDRAKLLIRGYRFQFPNDSLWNAVEASVVSAIKAAVEAAK